MLLIDTEPVLVLILIPVLPVVKAVTPKLLIVNVVAVPVDVTFVILIAVPFTGSTLVTTLLLPSYNCPA